MCGPLRPTPVRAEHEVETSGSRVFIAVSETDKRRKPHQTPAGQESRSSPAPIENIFCALFAIQPHRAASLGAHATVTHNLLSATLPLGGALDSFFRPSNFSSPPYIWRRFTGVSPFTGQMGGTESRNMLQIPQNQPRDYSCPEITRFLTADKSANNALPRDCGDMIHAMLSCVPVSRPCSQSVQGGPTVDQAAEKKIICAPKLLDLRLAKWMQIIRRPGLQRRVPCHVPVSCLSSQRA